MLEAVTTVAFNASLLRGAAEQMSAARSLAANPESTQIVPQAPYISPYVHLDVNFDKAVLQIRDSETGDVVRQIPSEPALESARRQMAAQARSEQLSKRLAPESTPAQQPQSSAARPAQSMVSASQPQKDTQASSQANPSFGAFAKQVASLQAAMAGGATGATVSLSA